MSKKAGKPRGLLPPKTISLTLIYNDKESNGEIVERYFRGVWDRMPELHCQNVAL